MSDPDVSMQRRDALGAVGLAAALVLIGATTAGGDAKLSANTWLEIALVVLGCGCGIFVLLRGARAPMWGASPSP